MKKQLLSLGLLALTSLSFGQIEIHYEGEALESPTAVVEGEVGGAFAFKGYYVVNTSGAPVELSWTRQELFAETCISDQVCTDESCYTPFDDGATFDSPENATIAVGDSIYFKVGAASEDVSCCAINRYYLKTGLGTVVDSIEVKYTIGETDCYLGVEDEVEPIAIATFPNPANDIFNVNVDQINGKLDFQLYNIVGDIVLTTVLTEGNNVINTSALSNGVYFYAVRKDGVVMETKKLVIRN